MQKVIFSLFIIISIISCKTTNENITIDGHTFKEFLAPGVIKISKNFYADERELSNIGYKEFMFWIKRVFGSNSPEYLQIIPDTTVWNYQNYYDSLHIKYFSNPAFTFHPLVGISLDQAKIYSNWRTDRVAEILLIRDNLIEINPAQNRDNYFTIDKYLNGTYEATIKIKPSLVLPKYTVPTMEEWEIIAGINSDFKFGVDSLQKHNKKLLKNSNYLFHTKEHFLQQLESIDQPENRNIKFVPTTSTEIGYKNIYGLKNIIGNVSELIDEVGVSKGGDWFHALDDMDLKKNTKTNIPNCWTGFRNVCRFELRKRKNNS